MEVMVIMSASGKKDPGGCWVEPRTEPRPETVQVYWLGPRSVGASDANGVRTSVGFWSEAALVERCRGVGRVVGRRASVKNDVGTSVGIWLATAWVEQRRDVGRAG